MDVKKKSPQAVGAVVRAFKKVTTHNPTKKTRRERGKFKRELLPSPAEFYPSELKRYT